MSIITCSPPQLDPVVVVWRLNYIFLINSDKMFSSS